mmetsp:Transcript_141604/g.394742  ORF Transcript_141604/g.394742 Transcript_141604/m.394742 type:complete len:457 (-) Transcript_141604:52-1422(-)
MVRDVREEYLLDPERAAGVGCDEGSTECSSLLAVEVLPQRQLLLGLRLKKLAEQLLDLGHSPASAHELDLLDVWHRGVGDLERLVDGVCETREHVLAHLFEVLALDGGLEVSVLIQGLNYEGRHLVGTQDGLRLLCLREQLSEGPRVPDDAISKLGVLFLELLEHGIRNLQVHEVPTNAKVDRRAQHCHDRRRLACDHARRAALEAHDRHLGFPRTQVVEEDQFTVALLGLEVNGTLHRKGGALVHQSQNTQPCDLARGNDCLALPERGVGRHGHDEVAHGLALAGGLRHLACGLQDVRQDLLRLCVVALCKQKGRNTAFLIIPELVGVELVSQAKVCPPLACLLDVLTRVIAAHEGVEEHGHLGRRLPLVSQRVVAKNPDRLEEGHSSAGLPLRMGIQDDLQRFPLAHEGDLEELMPKVDTHDLRLAGLPKPSRQEPHEGLKAAHAVTSVPPARL